MTTLPRRVRMRTAGLMDIKGERPLSFKQRRFVDEYLLDMNASAAAKRAGYSERSAPQIGSVFLRRPNVVAAIEARLADRRERMAVTTERVIRELARIAFSDIGRIVRWSGEEMIATPSELLSEDDRAAIAEIAVVKRRRGEVAARVILHDKERALEALCRFLGLFGPRGGLEAGLIENPTAAAERIREMIRAKHARLFAPEEADAEPEPVAEATRDHPDRGD